MQGQLREGLDDDTHRFHGIGAWSFSQALSTTPTSPTLRFEVSSDARHEQLRRLAVFSPRHAEELRTLRQGQAQSRHRRALLEWVAHISTRTEVKPRASQSEAANHREAWHREDRRAERSFGVPPERGKAPLRAHSCRPGTAEIFEWDPNQPRQPKGTSRGGQWAPLKNDGFLGAVIQRNQLVADLTGDASLAMIRSTRLAADLQGAARLSRDVTAAAAAGLGTGGKAVVNGSATAIKNVATLGLSSSQLELIGVTEADRKRGYDAAVTIATASGEVLIAVGTSGLATTLSKGGTVARTTSGVLLAYDSAGNAVGAVQGAYDARVNGINLENGLKIAGGALGLSTNVKAAGELRQASHAAKLARVEAFIAECPCKPTPTKSAANRYEIAHTGQYNYKVSVGGYHAEIDGYRGTTILEAKHAGSLKFSPYVPGSRFRNDVRRKIVRKLGDQLTRLRRIIRSGETPFTSVEIITNTPESKKFFERMLKVFEVPGTVRIAI